MPPFDDEPRLTDANRPTCPQCGIRMACLDCDHDKLATRAEDINHDDLYPHTQGWEILSPFGRWENVVRVDAPQYGPIAIYTRQSGQQPWRFWRRDTVTAVQKAPQSGGDPEIRLIEMYGRDGRMWLATTQSRIVHTPFNSYRSLADATYSRTDKCWTVSHRPGDDTEPVRTQIASKAKARTELKKLGRQYAKTMNVTFNPEPKQ